MISVLFFVITFYELYIYNLNSLKNKNYIHLHEWGFLLFNRKYLSDKYNGIFTVPFFSDFVFISGIEYMDDFYNNPNLDMKKGHGYFLERFSPPNFDTNYIKTDVLRLMSDTFIINKLMRNIIDELDHYRLSMNINVYDTTLDILHQIMKRIILDGSGKHEKITDEYVNLVTDCDPFRNIISIRKWFMLNSTRKKKFERMEYLISRLVILKDESSFDIISFLMKGNNHDLNLTCMNFMIPIQDPVMQTLCYLMYQCANNDLLAKRLIYDYESNYNPRNLHESLNKMKYFTACIRENLRKNIKAPSIRYALTDVKIKEVEISKGDILIFPHESIHYYLQPDPERFDPERINEPFVGFGKGVHACHGEVFALHIIKLVMYFLLKNRKWEIDSKTNLNKTKLNILTDLYLNSKIIDGKY